MNFLCMVYRIEKKPEILQRINDELVAVCNFSDWNPSHFLDVGEMSMAVAIGLDWTAGNLPEDTIELAETALIEKGLKTSLAENGKQLWWAYGNNKWDQVRNGGRLRSEEKMSELQSLMRVS